MYKDGDGALEGDGGGVIIYLEVTTMIDFTVLF